MKLDKLLVLLENLDKGDELSRLREFSPYLDVDIHPVMGQDQIYLSNLRAQKNAPPGTGTAFMNALCAYADKWQVIISLTIGQKERPVGNFKGTTSSDRLRKFYRRFGFRPNAKMGRYDLRGSWSRIPR